MQGIVTGIKTESLVKYLDFLTQSFVYGIILFFFAFGIRYHFKTFCELASGLKFWPVDDVTDDLCCIGSVLVFLGIRWTLCISESFSLAMILFAIPCLWLKIPCL